MPGGSTSRHTWTSGGHPGTPGPGQKSLMVPINAGGGLVVGRRLPRWRWGSIEKGAKSKGGYMQA